MEVPAAAAADTPESATADTGDVQLAVQRALLRLCEEGELDFGLILHRTIPDDTVRAVASYTKSSVPLLPEEDEAEHLWRLRRATDLGQPEQPEAAKQLAQRAGYSAAIALTPRDTDQRAGGDALLILVGGELDLPGRVRPRTLARLEALAPRLEAPLESAWTLSRLERLDGAVQNLDRLALLGSLVAEVIHEVRNPLVSIKTFLELLPEHISDPDFRGGFRRVVLDEVFRLERLLDGVISHARPGTQGTGAVETDVAGAIDATAQLLAHRAREAGAEILTPPTDEALRPASISTDALRQVLLNLCVNAISASPEGGRVRITARRRTSAQPPHNIEVWVEDEGDGVAENERELIFEPFRSTRTDAPGGLGLAISRRLAEQAGGRIFVAQATDGGARFVLRIPETDA